MKLTEKIQNIGKFFWPLILLTGILGTFLGWIFGQRFQPTDKKISPIISSVNNSACQAKDNVISQDVKQKSADDEIYFIGCGGVF